MKRAAFLPEGADRLGADEGLLWQGRPSIPSLAARLFRPRALAGYFALLAAWDLALAFRERLGAGDALVACGWVALACGGTVAFLYAAAACLAWTTRYVITTHRVILHIGIAFPISLTLPLRKIASADLRLHADGSGDIPLALDGGKLAYLLIWPHARPWRFAAPQPMLRAVPDAHAVAALLTRALKAASPMGEAKAVPSTARSAPVHPAPALADA